MRCGAPLLAGLCVLAACSHDGGGTHQLTPTATSTASAVATFTASATVPAATATSTPTATEPPSPTVPTLEPLAIHADPDRIRDAQGRVVLLRGANYSGLEFGNFIGNADGPDESDFAQMESWGFNVVRLPIAWSYMEAQPNQLDATYLREQVDPVVEFAARHGIVVVLEMHQFNWSRCFTNGNGAPAWVCDGRGYTDDFGGVVHAGCDFISGLTAPDGRTLQDHLADVWRLVARHYAGDRRIAGLDFLNEPHTFGCSTDAPTLTHALYEYYRRLRAAVRADGATQTLFAEPPVIRNLGVSVLTEPLGPDVVYAPHLYTQTGGLPQIKYNGDASTITADYALATAEAQGFGGPLFVAEFGGNTDADGGFRAATEQFLRDSLAEQDGRLIGGAVWAYFPSDNTFSVVDATGNEKGDLVNVLARPYARRIAGVPTEMRFDPTTKEFVFAWRVGDAAPGGGVTELFVPRRHYPGGFNVELPAGVAVSGGADSQSVLLMARDAGEYTVRIHP